MYELSLFVLDLVQNALSAQAYYIKIWLTESATRNCIRVTVADNGHGMSAETLGRAMDPFMTTKKNRKRAVGLGLPLFQHLVESCGGGFRIRSKEGCGTVVTGWYPFDNVDQPPRGDMPQTIAALVTASPEVNLRYTYTTDTARCCLDTREMRHALGEDAQLLWQKPEVYAWCVEACTPQEL